MIIDATGLNFKELNECLRHAGTDTGIENCLGQRFLAAGMSAGKIIVKGIPGNALGAYLDGAEITVNGNVQDSVGDTMNDGKIIIHGDAGDALGYAMRGGKIFVKNDAGYRTGIHMKEYKEKRPVIVVGGRTGRFLGEYLAGGIIIVLNLNGDTDKSGYEYTGTGMHGGKIFIRSENPPEELPAGVSVQAAEKENMNIIEEYLKEYTMLFDADYNKILDSRFYILRPNTANPYKQLYTITD